MKTIILIAFLFLISCDNKSDLDVKEGAYETIFPSSIDSVILHDFWFIRNDSFYIYRDGDCIYHTGIVWYGNRMDLFPFGSNPYYEKDFSHAKIVTVYYGFHFYPRDTDVIFKLQRFY